MEFTQSEEFLVLPPYVTMAQEALSNLNSKLEEQRSEVNRAFLSLQQTVKSTFDELTSQRMGDETRASSSAHCTATAGAARAMETLFRFLFECVYVHQLDTMFAFADKVEGMLQLMPTDVDVSSIVSVRDAFEKLRRAPVSVQRFQSKHFPEVPLMCTPQSELDLSTQKQHLPTLSRPTRRLLDGLTELPGPRVTPSTYNFAISAAYQSEERQRIVSIVTRVVRTAAAVLLPPVGHEEALACSLRCYFLVTPATPPAKLHVPHFPMEVLEAVVRGAQRGESADAHPGTSFAPWVAAEADEELAALLEALDAATVSVVEVPPLPTPSLPGGEISSLTAPLLGREELRSLTRRGASAVLKRRRTASAAALVPFRASAVACAEDDGRVMTRSALATNTSALQLTLEDEGVSHSLNESQLVQYHHEVPSAANGLDAMPHVEAVKLLRPAEWVFQISPSCKEHRIRLVEAIQSLGSVVDSGNRFNPRCTHLILAEGMTERTEKFLGARAAAKVIVSPRYVFDSLARGQWIISHMPAYCVNPPGGMLAAGGRMFAAWRVVLLTSHTTVSAGISNILRAGGCTNIHPYVYDGRAVSIGPSRPGEPLAGSESIRSSSTTPFPSPDVVSDCTHILVECQMMSAVSSVGYFELPPWFPPSLIQFALYPKLFTLELLYHCLSTMTEAAFDSNGLLVKEESLTPSCRVEPFGPRPVGGSGDVL